MAFQVKTAVIVVDVQNDFLLGGSLAVPNGNEVIPVIQEVLKEDWDVVVASQDYHPPNHISFASTHKGKEFSQLTLRNARGQEYEQTLWPAHCVIDSKGCEIDAGLRPELDRLGERCILVRKGWHPEMEAYSAFSGYVTPISKPAGPPEELPPPRFSELADYLQDRGVTRVLIVGLAGDYCVAATAGSAAKRKFTTAVLLPGVRSIDEKKAQEGFEKLKAEGVWTIPEEGWREAVREFMKGPSSRSPSPGK